MVRLSLTDTTALPRATARTVTTLALTDTVAMRVLDELAEMLPVARLALSVPVRPTNSDNDVGATARVRGGVACVTVTGRRTPRLLELRTTTDVLPAALPKMFRVALVRLTPLRVTVAVSVFAAVTEMLPFAPVICTAA